MQSPTVGKPLTSPSTNMAITDCTNMAITDSALTMLVPNVRARGQMLEHKAAKEWAWAEAERQWRNAEGRG